MKLLALLAIAATMLTPTVTSQPAPPEPPKPPPAQGDNAEPTTGAPAEPPMKKVVREDRPRGESMRAAVVPANSFVPPFDDYDDSTGERIISSAWKAGGHTDVHENFVRLTNDRQSKSGYIHNLEPIAMVDFSVYINFRISGAGQRLFGDGIAIWVSDCTAPDWRRGGTFFGGPADFKGFVIVLDTFKNSEMGASHKDVMLFTNDGQQDVNTHEPDAGGNANYRYYEGRDDFSVLDYSTLHLMYRASTKTVLVMLDEKNTGEFKTIIEHKIENLPRGWDKELRLSFSATTGQLADNHDLLSVKLIKAGGRLPRAMEEEDVNPREIQSLERQVQKQSGGAQIAKLMKLYRRDHERRLNHLHHAIEHELSFIQDSLASAISKLKAAEQDDHTRIEALEERAEEVARKLLDQHVASAVQEHLDEHLEDKVADHIVKNSDLFEPSEGFKAEISDAISAVAQNHQAQAHALHKSIQTHGGGAGWITIMIMCLVFGLVIFFLGRRVVRMEKNHLP